MRNTRIYHAGLLTLGETVFLNDMAARHVGAVLRMTTGECLCLFNGDGCDYAAKISNIHKNNIAVIIESKKINRTESPLFIHLGQAITRSEKMDWIIQKAVELGVTEITPLLTAYCTLKPNPSQLAKKYHHWQNIILSACEQSGRSVVPLLHPAKTVADWALGEQAGIKLVFSPHAAIRLRTLPTSFSSFQILIGPEGGLSSKEIAYITEHEFQCIKLGERILRTETAAIAAVSALQSYWGDF